MPHLYIFNLKPVFEIIPEAIFYYETNLICEISKDGLSYVFENDETKKFHGLSVFQFTKDADIPGQLKKIFKEQPLMSKTYKKVFVAYAGEESALLPEDLYKPGGNELLLNMLYGNLESNGIIATDLIADKKIYNVYRMPDKIHRAMVDQFPLASFHHRYSLLIKQLFTYEQLRLIFYRDTFIAVLIKEGELQIIHTYPYQSATDVVYHLQNLCNQFKVTGIPVYIGGMIDIDSDLHKEISRYFSNIVFDSLPGEYEFANNLKELPPHYFSHLFSLALCV